MRPSSSLVQPVRHGGRNAVRQAVPRRRRLTALDRDAEIFGAPALRRLLHRGFSPKRPRSSFNQAYQTDSGRIYNMQAELTANLPQSHIPDSSHILAEWRLLERQALKNLKGKGKASKSDVERGCDGGGTQMRDWEHVDGQFFTPRFPSIEVDIPSQDPVEREDVHAEASTSATATTTDVELPNIDAKEKHNETLWIATIDPDTMTQAMTVAISEIQNGNWDLNLLATNVFGVIGRQGITLDNQDVCWEQVRILILSYWLAIVRRGVDQMPEQDNVQSLLLRITESLYTSSVQHYSPSQQHSPGLMAIQRATLFRLVASVLERITSVPECFSSTKAVALRLASLALQDKRLRGSQARFMAKKVVKGFESQALSKSSSPAFFSAAWKEMSHTLIALCRRGTLSCATNKSGEANGDVVMRFLKACNSEAQKARSQYGATNIANLLFSDSFVPLTIEFSKPGSIRSGETVDGAMGGLVLFQHNTLSKSNLTTLVRIMTLADQYVAARSIYGQAAPQARSFEAACYLMRAWSGAALSLDRGSRSAANAKVTRRPGNPFASQLLNAACEQLEWHDDAKLTKQLDLLAACRFSSHFKKADVHALVNDLDELARLWSTLRLQASTLTRSDLLTRLGARAQLAAVRTFARCDRLGNAIQVATRIAKAQRDKVLSTKLANALFATSVLGLRDRLTLTRRSPLHRSHKQLIRTRWRSTSTACGRPALANETHQTRRGLDVLRGFCRSSGASLNRASSILILRQMACSRGVRLPNSVLGSLADRMNWHTSEQDTSVNIAEALLLFKALKCPFKRRRSTLQDRMTTEQQEKYHAIENVFILNSSSKHTS